MSSNNGGSARTNDEEGKFCQEILDSADYFEALGFSKYGEGSIEIGQAELRKAYLKRSMKCHPDKNKDPRSTEAFQRLAISYETLRDEQKKREYVALLQQRSRSQAFGFDSSSSFRSSSSNVHEFNIDLNSINLADAFALFASMVEEANPVEGEREKNLFDRAADALMMIDSFTNNSQSSTGAARANPRTEPSALQSWSSTLRQVGMVTSVLSAIANASQNQNQNQNQSSPNESRSNQNRSS